MTENDDIVQQATHKLSEPQKDIVIVMDNIACEQAPSEVGKNNLASEWESEPRDSASEASGTRGSL